MNSVNITGRLTRDPSSSETERGTAVSSFGIAWNEPFGEKKANFFDVTAFGKPAEFAAKWLKKGTKVEVTGRLSQERFTNRDGVEVNRVKIIASELGFAESKGQETQQKTEAPREDDFVQIPEGDLEELPFN